MELKKSIICKKCNTKAVNFLLIENKRSLVCKNCFAYWNEGTEEGKWKFKGYLKEGNALTQQTTKKPLAEPAGEEKTDTTQQIKGKGKKGTGLKCPRCKYEWKSKGKMFWVTCPRCMRKFEK